MGARSGRPLRRRRRRQQRRASLNANVDVLEIKTSHGGGGRMVIGPAEPPGHYAMQMTSIGG